MNPKERLPLVLLVDDDPNDEELARSCTDRVVPLKDGQLLS